MSESNDNNSTDARSSNDDLMSSIRAALAPDASSDARTSAAHACRTLLRSLEPAPARNGSPGASPAAMLAGTPIGNALSALGSLPRDQVLQLLATGMRVLFGQGSPSYRAAPLHRPTDTTERAR